MLSKIGDPHRPLAVPLALRKGSEAVKESRNEQRNLAQNRKGAEAEKKVKDLLVSTLCVSAPLPEIRYFFTTSLPFRRARGKAPMYPMIVR